MPLTLLPPMCPSKSRNSSRLPVSSQQSSSVVNKPINVAATEAAEHRRKLNELRQVFLGSSVVCASNDNENQNINSEDTLIRSLNYLDVSDAHITDFDSHTAAHGPNIGHRNLSLSTTNSSKLEATVGRYTRCLTDASQGKICDQIDTVDQLPASGYVPFEYDAKTAASSLVFDPESTTTVSFMRPVKFPTSSAKPGLVSLSTDELSCSSDSGSVYKLHDFVVPTNYDDNSIPTKRYLTISNLYDVKKLSDLCKGDSELDFMTQDLNVTKMGCNMIVEKMQSSSSCQSNPVCENECYDELCTQAASMDLPTTSVSPISIFTKYTQSCQSKITNNGGAAADYDINPAASSDNDGDSFSSSDKTQQPPAQCNHSSSNATNHMQTKKSHNSTFDWSPNSNVKCTSQLHSSVKSARISHLNKHQFMRKHNQCNSDSPRLKGRLKYSRSINVSLDPDSKPYTPPASADTRLWEHCLDKIDDAIGKFETHLSRADATLNNLERCDFLQSSQPTLSQSHTNGRKSFLVNANQLERVQNKLLNVSTKASLSSLPSSSWSFTCCGDNSHANSTNTHRIRRFGIPLPGMVGCQNSKESSFSLSPSSSSPPQQAMISSTNLPKLSMHAGHSDVQFAKSTQECGSVGLADDENYLSDHSITSPYVDMVSATASGLSSILIHEHDKPSLKFMQSFPLRRRNQEFVRSTTKLDTIHNKSLELDSCVVSNLSASSSTLSTIETRKSVQQSQRIYENCFVPVNKQQSNGHGTTIGGCHKKVRGLANKLSAYLSAGQESKARELLKKMLCRPDTRRYVEALISVCGNHLKNLLDPKIMDVKNDSTTSLLHLTASLSDIHAHLPAQSNLDFKRRNSAGSLLQTPYPTLDTSDRRLSSCINNWNVLNNTTKNNSLGDGGSAQLYSTYSVKFVKWPSTGCLEAKMKPIPPAPPPAPPVLSKSSIMPSEDRLQILDAHAIQVTNCVHLTFRELLTDLTPDLSNTLEIVRSLFRWITSKDLRCEDYDPHAPPSSLVGMLRRIKCNQLSRNELFHEICRYVGIHCRLITGYSKGAHYRPGMQIHRNNLFRNSWLAVYICDGWRFVNCDWGARYLVQNSVFDAYNLCEAFPADEFYFLTDPEQHIFENFPDIKPWQLLRKPLSLDRFCHLPLLKSSFFNANLTLKKNYADCLITKNGQVSVKLKMTKFVAISCTLENCVDQTLIHGLNLVEVLLHPSDIVRIQTAPSQPGQYYLNIYVATDWKEENKRELACAFQIECCEYNYSRLIVTGRLPEVGFLGRTPAAQKYGVVMLPEGDVSSGRPYIVHGYSRTLRLPFALAPGLKLCHQLKSFDRPGQQMVDCDSYALLQMRPINGSQSMLTDVLKAQYHLRLPTPAFYYLTIYASEESDISSDHLECVYRILIDARKAHTASGFHVLPYPHQSFWWVYCRLLRPNTQKLAVGKHYTFCLDAPRFDSVAVVINESDWYFLSPSVSNSHPGRWSGKIFVGNCLGRLSVFGRFPHTNEQNDRNKNSQQPYKSNCSRSLNNTTATHISSNSDSDNDDSDECSYIKLLDYVLVQSTS